jgi:hypothetical protein
MGAVTTAIIVGAAVVGAGATAYSADQQNQAGRRSETRAKGIAADESRRQEKQQSLLAAQEGAQAQKTAGVLRATAGRRAGRRSLITGPETGTQLASTQSLG